MVLIGPSHIGKTYFFRHVLPEPLNRYYADSNLSQGKDSKLLLSEKLIVNNDEFGGIVRMKEVEEFKFMASAEYFNERRSYGRKNLPIRFQNYQKRRRCATEVFSS